MNIDAVQGFLNHADPAARASALQYFEQLKVSDTGWQMCMNCLTSGKQDDDGVMFFCFQVLSHFIRTRYEFSNAAEQQLVKNFISQWIQIQHKYGDSSKKHIQNKAAQLICMIFLIDYPKRWPTFFKDLLQTLSLGTHAVDAYLRILLAINSEIADREIIRTQKELEHFTEIKDTMRDNCVSELVDSWYHIMTTYQTSNIDLVSMCLSVIGSYIAWIDINLIANDRFVGSFIHFLKVPRLRDSTCDCISDIINKGMDPVAKVKLVESFATIMNQSGALNVTEDEDDEFTVKVADLVNGMGTQLLTAWSRLQKLRDPEGCALASDAIHKKIVLLLKFLNSEDEDVSHSVIEFAREYLQFLKHQAAAGFYGASEIANVEAMLYIVINKYKYDPSTNFLHQGEEEALFEDYRKSLKVLFDNLILLDTQVVFTRTKDVIMNTLQHWKNLPFQDVEVAITFLYLLGEAVPASQHLAGDGEKKTSVIEMLRLLVTCGVSSHGHVVVTLQFFETVVRFEKFFAQETQYIPQVLVAFLDERGLRNPSPHIRSRTSFLFSRFIKCLRTQVHSYTEDILRRMQDLLALAPPENGMAVGLLSPDDQLYLYETAAILIINSHFEAEKKHLLLKSLLTPLAEKFEVLLQKLPLVDQHQQHAIAKCMNHAIAVTSRTSKAFSNHQTMKSCGCVQVYCDALQVFLGALSLPIEQPTLQSAVRQYLHRMVVCLESAVLPFIPSATEQLLKSSDIRSIQEFIPLINQIITKFKKEIVPLLQQIFMPLVTEIFRILSVPVDENDQQAQSDRQLLLRSYFNFISAIVNNNITEVIASQDMQNMEQVLQTVIQGAVDFPDPVAQKTCFSILKKMVELWGGPDGAIGFVEFMYKSIVPCCFMAPLKDTFDLNDAQTSLALTESALCLKMVLDKRGDEFISYLQTQYLPTLNVSPEQIQQYCQALKSDTKAFRNFLKFFFQKART